MSDYSLNETASLLRLAAKGAGYSWGHADEVSRAGYWLTSRNFPAPALIANLLRQLQTEDRVDHFMPVMEQGDSAHTTVFKAVGSYLCPILLGSTISDGVVLINRSDKICCFNVKSPALLLPFIADLSQRLNQTVSVSFDSNKVIVDDTHIRVDNRDVMSLEVAKSIVVALHIENEFVFGKADKPEQCSRVSVEPAIWQLLEEFAHRTYAPATESSRLLGAGAGTLDND